jgi:hypothetical protein
MMLVKEEEGGREREKEESLVGDDEIKTWGFSRVKTHRFLH